jgi:hypothetical protein
MIAVSNSSRSSLELFSPNSPDLPLAPDRLPWMLVQYVISPPHVDLEPCLFGRYRLLGLRAVTRPRLGFLMFATRASATDSAFVRTATIHSTYLNRIGMEFSSDQVGTVRRCKVLAWYLPAKETRRQP